MELGAVLTATELEGCAPASDWSLWARNGRAPIPDPAMGNAFVSGWADDLDQLAGIGITSVQITLEWAHIEPQPSKYDEDAVEFRRQIMAGARERGLSVWACLVDGTLPGWFADDNGGFNDKQARTLLWPRHIDWIGERFGDLVDGWIPQREGIHWALRRYLRGNAPPGHADPRMAAEAVRSAVLADGEAWRLLQGTSPVAMYQTARTIRPVADDVKATRQARALERLLWHPWLSALSEGQLVVGDLPDRKVDYLRGAFDRVIVELRPAIEVTGSGQWRPYPPERRRGPSGWIAWPETMADALHRVSNEVGDHEIVAAGSLADVADDGNSRPDHLRTVLDDVEELAGESNVVGWWQSSPIDGYHWQQGAKLSPGIIDRNRQEQLSAQELRRRVATDAG